MKTICAIGISVLILLSYHTSYACDACGGMTINQNDNDISFNNKIAYTFSYNRYSVETVDDQPNVQQNYFFSSQFAGTYVPHERVLLRFVLPINGITIPTSNSTGNWGLGDVSFSSYFNLLDKVAVEKSIKHRLNVGVGTTIPTGKRLSSIKEGTENLGLQLSAESWALFGQLDYSFQVKKLSITQTNSISLYVRNKSDYRFGNIYNHGLRVQLQMPLESDNLMIAPFIITSYEHSNRNLHNGFIRKFTGYDLFNLSSGLVFRVKNHNISVLYSQPLWQKQNNPLIKKQAGMALSYIYKFKSI